MLIVKFFLTLLEKIKKYFRMENDELFAPGLAEKMLMITMMPKMLLFLHTNEDYDIDMNCMCCWNSRGAPSHRAGIGPPPYNGV